MKATSSRPLLNTWMNCVRVCSISVALSFCSLAPSSARADVEFDAPTMQAVTNLALSLSGTSATPATVEDNVEAILSLLQSVSRISSSGKFATAPYNSAGGNVSIGRTLYNLLGEGDLVDLSVAPSSSSSYLFEVQRALYGRAGSPAQADAILPTLSRVESLLRARPAYTNDLDVINGLLMGIMNDHGYYLSLIRDNTYNAATDLTYLLTGWVGLGQYDNAWDVALVPDQFDEFRQMLQDLEHTSGTFGETIVGAIEDATRTNAAIAGDLHALRLGLLDDYDTIDTVEEHADTVSEYVDEDIETNALAALTISPGDAGDLSPVLDLVDPDSFDVLPSLTGGDPVVQVFTASRDSNLPAFSIDFSLPSGFRTFIHAVCVWLWRMLFFLSMWRLVNEEYGYWSTLGGSAG